MLQEKAMLAQLTIKQWTARKQDKKVTAEVEASHGAHDAGRFNKDLVNRELLAPISKLVGATRDKHYSMTHAWNDNGQRLLPSKLFLEYTTMIRTAKAEYQRLLGVMMAQYPAEVQAARNRLGSMYDPGDYPDVSDLRNRFSLEAEFAPVPSANDFRVDVGAEVMAEIRENITNTVHAKQGEAIKATFERIKDVVSKIEERLSDEKAIFKDTLITNASDLCRVLDGLNITDDPVIARVSKEIYDDLLVAPSQLRANMTLRAKVARRAGEILRTLP